ncbi:AbrB/MazE/SpoVT family DNA-binding domain-containing protein [Chloroflexota bacterium]
MPTITFRKLIKFGAGSFVVSVPRSWVRYYNLKSGDKLEVIANGKLIIRPIVEHKSK